MAKETTMTTKVNGYDSIHHRHSRVTGKDPNSNGIPGILESDVLDDALAITPTKWWRKAAQLLVCASTGIVFGFAMEKGRVFEPWLIRQQMQFRKFVMMKMFLSAVASSLICFSIISVMPAFKTSFQTASRNYLSGVFSKSITATALGGAVLGIGMTLSGGCPGNVLIQFGSGVDNAGTTFIGCLVGALVYGLLESSIANCMTPGYILKTYTLEKYFKVKYLRIALPLAGSLMMLVAMVEYFFPWTSELTAPQDSAITLFHLRAWPSFLCGGLIGLLQIPIILTVEDTLGGSSSYCTMVSQAFSHDGLNRWSPYLAKFSGGMDNWWQVFYVASAILGGFFSSYLSGTYGSAQGIGAVEGFLGGIFMVFGARLAGGCTSGHGLSGLGTLNILSFVAVPAMFAGGMATAAIMDALGHMEQ